jgi:hypothetical protein
MPRWGRGLFLYEWKGLRTLGKEVSCYPVHVELKDKRKCNAKNGGSTNELENKSPIWSYYRFFSVEHFITEWLGRLESNQQPPE